MRKKIISILLMSMTALLLAGCFNSECDEPLLDYNQNGKTDPGDYDIMKSAEQACKEGY